MKKVWISSFCLLLVLGAFPLFSSLSIYSLQDKLLFSTHIKNHRSFIITYEHSIHKSPVMEYFQLDDLELVLKKVKYEDTSIGMPSNAPEGASFKLENGKYIIENLDTRLDEIFLLVDQVSANYQLLVNNEKITLHTIAPKGSTIKIKVEKISFYQWLERRMK
ncbi:DUF1850 domain-containing protein [Mangrovibacillus cuniculi]|uniref:DUF1850 domain-containing protein n=1 Tax=Mangrovibacillus cuniculi TaxID=2593652 RepID=A0A7S8CA08_9BACI|nr:DUF1850 domain-containing protein [Mangrovibacillus cuniculi]QPC46107.1 DUF1850 domain-containing protein [Mangrovibacillus cuniculi]